MLACNQNGVMGSLIIEEPGLETWRVFQKDFDNKGWIGIFNRSFDKISFRLDASRLGFADETYTLYDVWNRKELLYGSMIDLEPNGVLFIKFGD